MLISIYGNVRNYDIDIDVYGNVYMIDEDSIVYVSLSLSINKNANIILIR